MTDIVPELYEQILQDYISQTNADAEIKSFMSKRQNGKATSEDVSQYAGALGRCASKALLKNLTPESLPDGVLYRNIAERTIRPLLEKVYETVNDAASEITRLEDKKIGIKIEPQRGVFPEERIKTFLDQLAGLDLNEVEQ